MATLKTGVWIKNAIGLLRAFFFFTYHRKSTYVTNNINHVLFTCPRSHNCKPACTTPRPWNWNCKLNSAIINLINYTSAFSAITCQNVFKEIGLSCWNQYCNHVNTQWTFVFHFSLWIWFPCVNTGGFSLCEQIIRPFFPFFLFFFQIISCHWKYFHCLLPVSIHPMPGGGLNRAQ